MKKYFLSILLIVFGINVHAQDHAMDSLKLILQKTSEDTNRLHILEAISVIAPDGEWENYNEEMGMLAQKLIERNNYSSNTAKRYLAIFLSNKGFIATHKGDLNSAVNYLSQAEKLDLELKYYDELATVTCSIGALYDRQGDQKKALIKYNEALNYEKKSKNIKSRITILNNIGKLYSSLSKPDSALMFYNEAISLINHEDYPGVGMMAYIGLGDIYENKNDLDNALKNFLLALKGSEKYGIQELQIFALNNIGSVYFKKHNDSLAFSYTKKAHQIAIEIGHLLGIMKTSRSLKEIYLKQGDTSAAYQMYSQEITSRDSIERIENQKAVIQHQFKYEFDIKAAFAKAEQQKKDQRQRAIRNSIAGGLAISLIFLIVVYRQRNKIAKERKRSDELLLNILPAEVAEELKQKGSAEAQQIDEVTVLFTDFKGFTQLSEKLTPKELVGEINICFSAFDNIMQKHGVEKIKTIGDAYMAAGGLPNPNKTHAEDVVKAALEIQDFMLRHKAEKELEGKLFFEIRIGVHTGPVVAGIVGIKKFTYDIWGDTVNTASRMESSGEVGKVNISSTTYKLVKDKFNCINRGKIRAKGKGEIDMYFVEGRI